MAILTGRRMISRWMFGVHVPMYPMFRQPRDLEFVQEWCSPKSHGS